MIKILTGYSCLVMSLTLTKVLHTAIFTLYVFFQVFHIVYLNDELARGIRLDQDRSCTEETFQLGEGRLYLGCEKGDLGGGKSGKGCCDLAEVGKAQEPLNPFPGGGLRPFSHSSVLAKIRPHLPTLNDVAQKAHRTGVKFTFLCLHIEFVFQKPLEDLANMKNVFSYVFGEDEYITKVQTQSD